MNALGAAAEVNGDAFSSCFALLIGLNALEAKGDAGAAETEVEANGDDGAADEDANGDGAAGVSSTAFAAGSGLAAGLAEPTADGLEAAEGLVVRLSVLAELIGLKGLEGDAVWGAALGASSSGFTASGLATGLDAKPADEGLETASGLAAGLAEPTDDGLEAAAGLVARVSVLAALIGLKWLGTSGAMLLGAGASFSFFSEAGLKALGVPAGLYVDAPLARFAAPAGLNGLEGADV